MAAARSVSVMPRVSSLARRSTSTMVMPAPSPQARVSAIDVYDRRGAGARDPRSAPIEYLPDELPCEGMDQSVGDAARPWRGSPSRSNGTVRGARMALVGGGRRGWRGDRVSQRGCPRGPAVSIAARAAASRLAGLVVGRWRAAILDRITRGDRMLTLADVQAAAERLAPYLQETLTVRSRLLSERLDCDVYLKQENLQRGGSFKLRGALNRLLTLTAEKRARGVIIASAGNHGQGVAIAASIAGCRATVVMPHGASLAKVAATRDYGARVLFQGLTYDDAQAYAQRLAGTRRLAYIHAFDDLAVMAGQGTVALEMLAAVPDLTTLVVPVGGGGLIGGMATVAKAWLRPLRVYGVQASGA